MRAELSYGASGTVEHPGVRGVGRGLAGLLLLTAAAAFLAELASLGGLAPSPQPLLRALASFSLLAGWLALPLAEQWSGPSRLELLCHPACLVYRRGLRIRLVRLSRIQNAAVREDCLWVEPSRGRPLRIPQSEFPSLPLDALASWLEEARTSELSPYAFFLSREAEGFTRRGPRPTPPASRRGPRTRRGAGGSCPGLPGGGRG